MYSVLLSLYLIVSILLIGLILVQHGKGASMGASFGAGASNTVFGSTGNGNFLTHSTAVLATLFFAISLGLSALYAHDDDVGTDFSNLQSVADQSEAAKGAADAVLPADSVETKKDVDLPAVTEQKLPAQEEKAPVAETKETPTAENLEAVKTEVENAESAKIEVEKAEAVKTEVENTVAPEGAVTEEKVTSDLQNQEKTEGESASTEQ